MKAFCNYCHSNKTLIGIFSLDYSELTPICGECAKNYFPIGLATFKAGSKCGKVQKLSSFSELISKTYLLIRGKQNASINQNRTCQDDI